MRRGVKMDNLALSIYYLNRLCNYWSSKNWLTLYQIGKTSELTCKYLNYLHFFIQDLIVMIKKFIYNDIFKVCLYTPCMQLILLYITYFEKLERNFCSVVF